MGGFESLFSLKECNSLPCSFFDELAPSHEIWERRERKKNEVSDDCCGHETREREVEECVTQKERKKESWTERKEKRGKSSHEEYCWRNLGIGFVSTIEVHFSRPSK